MSRHGQASLGLQLEIGIVTKLGQGRLFACRDTTLGVATRPLVSRHDPWCRTGQAGCACRDQACTPNARQQRAHARTTAHNVRATGRNAHTLCTQPRLAIEHCLGHCSWTLFNNTVHRHCSKKKKKTLGIWGITVCYNPHRIGEKVPTLYKYELLST